MDAIRYALSQEGGNSVYGFYSKKEAKFDEEGLAIKPKSGSPYAYK